MSLSGMVTKLGIRNIRDSKKFGISNDRGEIGRDRSELGKRLHGNLLRILFGVISNYRSWPIGTPT